MDENSVSHAIIGAAIEVHKILGPGLLESAYQECLAHELSLKGIAFQRELELPITYKDIELECGYRINFNVPLLKDGIKRFAFNL